MGLMLHFLSEYCILLAKNVSYRHGRLFNCYHLKKFTSSLNVISGLQNVDVGKPLMSSSGVVVGVKRHWELFSWLASVGTTRNTVIRPGWSRIGLAVLIRYAAATGLTDRHAVISGRYNKCHSPQLQKEPLCTRSDTATHTSMRNITMRNRRRDMIMEVEALHAGRGRMNPVWSGKEAHWSLRGWIVKSAEHCGADYKPLDR